jgi:uncharacterized damage-inducible protein DinB
MPSSQIHRLATFSESIRESSFKRFAAVPEGRENWRPVATAMSFADILQHLIDCDNWLFQKLKTPNLASIRGAVGQAEMESRDDFERLLDEYRATGNLRTSLISNLSEGNMSRVIPDDRFGGEVETWWVIVRGNLDHEIQHRGQLAAYLRILGVGC